MEAIRDVAREIRLDVGINESVEEEELGEEVTVSEEVLYGPEDGGGSEDEVPPLRLK